MGPLMYRQRPALPALIFTICVLLAGTGIAFRIKHQADLGLADESSIMLVGCITIALACCGIVATFARYQFVHLWKKKPVPEPEEVFPKEQSRGRW